MGRVVTLQAKQCARIVLRVAACAAGVPMAACDGGDPESAESAMMEADREFARATAERRLEGWVDHFAERGFMLRDGVPIEPGKSAVRRMMEPAFADEGFALAWDPDRAHATASGAFGYTVGRYESRSRVDGQAIAATGRYLTVWQRQEDGAWKVLFDAGVPDPPPER